MKRAAAIALGSNLASAWGDRAANLHQAIRRVGQLGEVTEVSSFYDTAPVGFTQQPDFLNAALLLETELEPVQLMRALLAVEREMGRDRTTAVAKGPRVIDLDLLLMGDVVMATAAGPDKMATAAGPDNQTDLTLPHPAMAQRRFVLEPLAEIAPDWVHPPSGRTVADMLADVNE